jgi:hypothetical protein
MTGPGGPPCSNSNTNVKLAVETKRYPTRKASEQRRDTTRVPDPGAHTSTPRSAPLLSATHQAWTLWLEKANSKRKEVWGKSLEKQKKKDRNRVKI